MKNSHNFDAKQIYLAARLTCQFWDHQKLFSTPAKQSSSQPSNSAGLSSPESGPISSKPQNHTDDKTSDQSD